MPSKILFVDDDPNLLDGFKRTYRKQFEFDVALGGEEALKLIQSSGPYAVVLVDMNMPGMNGVELLERIRQTAPQTVRMMLTGNADQRTAADAVNRGAVSRFLNKPCPPDELVPALQEGLKTYERAQIEREVLETTLTGSVKVLASILGMLAPEALGRGQKIRRTMRIFSARLGMQSNWECDLAALLVNIGYALVPPAVLGKIKLGLPLNDEQREIIARTPKIGHDLLIGIPRLSRVAKAIYYQNAHFDGSGYPGDGVAGKDLPVIGRILKILNDRLDLETAGVVKAEAFATMQQRDGVYDPKLLEQCFVCCDSFVIDRVDKNWPVIPVAAQDLKQGDVMVSDILGKGGMPIVTAGSRLDPMIIERIRNFALIGEVQEPLIIQRPAGSRN